MVRIVEGFRKQIPHHLAEDGMAEEDCGRLEDAYDSVVGDKIQLVGDDLFVPNVERLSKGIELGRLPTHPH
jgi:enolase